MYSLDKFMNGAMTERFSEEMRLVAMNVLDPNTKPEFKRKIIITLEVVPDEERDIAVMNLSVCSKLAPALSVAGKMVFGRDTNTGQAIANEYGRSAERGQVEMVVTDDGETVLDTKEEFKGLKVVGGNSK